MLLPWKTDLAFGIENSELILNSYLHDYNLYQVDEKSH